MDWIKRKCRLGWKPGVIKSHVVGYETYDIPALTRTDKAWNMWETFAEEHPARPIKKEQHPLFSAHVRPHPTATKTQQKRAKIKNSEPRESTTS